MIGFILAGGVFGICLVRALVRLCSAKDYADEIEVILEMFEEHDIYVNAQGEESAENYYNYLCRVMGIYARFNELKDKSVICKQLNNYKNVVNGLILELAAMDPEDTSNIYLDVVHNLAMYQATGKYEAGQLGLCASPPTHSNAITQLLIMTINDIEDHHG